MVVFILLIIYPLFSCQLSYLYTLIKLVLCADVIDVVRDQLSEYVPQEDPKQYVSEKTGRGPLTDNWLDEYWDECKVSYI